MKKSFTLLATSIFLLAFLGTSNATLLVNGDFDDETIGLTGGQSAVFDSIPGWTKDSNTEGIEVHRNTIVTADSLTQYVELDSTKNSSMYQALNLFSGEYALDWMYHARTNDNGNDNGIKFFVYDAGNTAIYDNSISKKTEEQASVWEQVSWTFSIPEYAIYTLRFAAYGKNNSLGGFIDSVTLTSLTPEPEPGPTPNPEPATMLLFGLGILGLAGVTRHIREKR